MIDFLVAQTDNDFIVASKLFKEYAAWLNIDLSFQHFDDELASIKTMYSKPNGGIIICKNENEFIGCAGIRKIDGEIAELKRMFVKPTFQNNGIGKNLLQKAVEFAKECNYKTIRLDTLNYMTSAITLYKKHGFYEIPPYYFNPNKTAVYFELKC